MDPRQIELPAKDAAMSVLDGIKVGGAVAAFVIIGLMTVAKPAESATATFDFNAIADGASFYSTADPVTARSGFEGNWNENDGINPGIRPVVGSGEGIVDRATGIEVYATGSNSRGFQADAFFDSNNAGLGVCSIGISGSCKTGVKGAKTGDDNLNRVEEALTFAFNQPVNLIGMTVRNADHGLLTGTMLIGSDLFDVLNGAVDPVKLSGMAASIMFGLGYVENGGEIYVGDMTVAPVAPIPLPAGVWLMMAAGGMLGALKVRRRAAA